MAIEVKPITPELAVSPQIEGADLAELAAQGFKSVICNRPDGESFGQPQFAEIAQAAAQAGLAARYVPVVSGRLTGEDVDAFADALATLPKPIVAYCRSGTRCTVLWALSETGKRPADEIIEAARAAGFDVSGIVRR